MPSVGMGLYGSLEEITMVPQEFYTVLMEMPGVLPI
jgi:hypothetical protein